MLQKYFWFLATRIQSYSVLFKKKHGHSTFTLLHGKQHFSWSSVSLTVVMAGWNYQSEKYCIRIDILPHIWDNSVCFREIHPEFSAAPVNAINIRQPLDCFICSLKAYLIGLCFQQVSEGVEVNSKGRHNWTKITLLLAHEKLMKYWLPKRSEIFTLSNATLEALKQTL